jgi:hypothetical protein
MRRAIACIVVVLSLLASGCSVYKIHEKKGIGEGSFFCRTRSVPGVPFYATTAKLKQTTTRSRTWLEVRFTLSGDNTATETAVLCLKEGMADSVELAKGIGAAQAKSAEEGATIGHVVEAFSDTPGIETISQEEIDADSDVTRTETEKVDERVISDVKETKEEIDYAHPYYYNVTLPFFGKSEATLKIQSNGTLSEATANVDATKLADVFTEVLKTAVSVADRAAVTARSKGGETGKRLTRGRTLGVTSTREGYLYELSRIYDNVGEENRAKRPLTFSDAHSIKRTDLSTKESKSAAEEKPKEESTKNAYTFQGSVKLPEKK